MEAARRCVSPSRAAAGCGAAPTVPGPAAATGFLTLAMDGVMRRMIAILALLGGLAAGCCHHIAGKNDCGYNPADYPIGPPTPPHPTTVAPAVPVSKEKIPDTIPKSINNGPVKSEEAGPPSNDSGY